MDGTPTWNKGSIISYPLDLYTKPSFVEFCWSGPNQPRNLNYSMLCNIDMPMDKYHTTDSKFITCWFLNPMLVPIIKSRAYKISFQRLSSRPLTLVFKGYPKTTTGSGRIWRRFHDFWCFFFGLPLLTISPQFHSIVKKKQRLFTILWWPNIGAKPTFWIILRQPLTTI